MGDGDQWNRQSAYNAGNSTVIIVDNQCIAMTGGQSLPSGDFGNRHKAENQLDIAAACRSLGMRDVVSVDPYDAVDLHVDFLSEDKTVLGQVLNCTLPAGLVEISCKHNLNLILPATEANYDLDLDHTDKDTADRVEAWL